MVHLDALDAAIVVLFVAAILALGFSAKLRENTTLQFIAAGRMLTLPMFVATLVATWYGGILGIGESVQWYGTGTWLLLGVPYYAFALLYAFVLAKRVRAADQISIPERVFASWGRGPSLIAAALVFLLGVPAVHVLMLGNLAQSVTGWDLTTSVIVATFVSSLFLYKGGLLADARVSMLAFAMMYVGFAVIVVYCLVRFPIGETWATFSGTPSLSVTGGQGAVTIVSYFILGAWTLIDPGFHQRVASARDPETGKKGVLVAVVCWVLFDVLSVTAGMYALALTKEPPSNTLLLFPSFGSRILPSGLRALFFCGMLGTILTAMVGYSLVSGATLGRDILAREMGVKDERRAAGLARLGIFVSCVTAVLLALQFKSVVAIWYRWSGVLVGPLLIPTLLGYLSRRPQAERAKAVSFSMLAGFIISLGWLLVGSGIEKGQALKDRIGVSFDDIGTLLPGALASAVAYAIGTWAAGRSRR